MKRTVFHTVCALLAVYFFAAGSGVNVAHYCCDACAEHGMRMFAEGSCEEVHHNHQHHEHASAHCCEQHHRDGIDTTHNACTLQRVATDIPVNEIYYPDFAPLTACVITLTPDADALSAHCATYAPQAYTHAPPLISHGRAVLTRIALLLI
ncbi:MAG: hypothetical protein ACI392_06175 [Paludibacteraceae bacterium]